MDGRRSGCARVLDPGGRLEAQVGRSLEHQGGGEILRREAGVEVAEEERVAISRRDAGIVKRGSGRADHQAFHRFVFEAAEGRVAPANDARRHGTLLNRKPNAWLRTFPQSITVAATRVSTFAFVCRNGVETTPSPPPSAHPSKQKCCLSSRFFITCSSFR